MVLGYEWRQALTISAIGGIVSLSLVVVTALVGQISLSQMAVSGCAAFLLTRLSLDWAIPFPFAPLLAPRAPALVGLHASIPPARSPGVTLAVVPRRSPHQPNTLVFNPQDLLHPSSTPSIA